MSQIALDTHPYYLLPGLDYQGSPVGIDMRKVITTGVVPSSTVVSSPRT